MTSPTKPELQAENKRLREELARAQQNVSQSRAQFLQQNNLFQQSQEQFKLTQMASAEAHKLDAANMAGAVANMTEVLRQNGERDNVQKDMWAVLSQKVFPMLPAPHSQPGSEPLRPVSASTANEAAGHSTASKFEMGERVMHSFKMKEGKRNKKDKNGKQVYELWSGRIMRSLDMYMVQFDDGSEVAFEAHELEAYDARRKPFGSKLS